VSADLLPDGIYFDLPEDVYRAHPALGSTDLKALYISPVQWQFKRLAAFRETIGLGDEESETETAGKRFGRAVHTMVLEGAEAFEARHCVEPDAPEGLLSTIEDMKTAIRESGRVPPADLGAPSKWKRAEFVRACREMGIGPLSDDWAEEREAIIGERGVISQRWFATIRLIGTMLDVKRESLGGKSQREAVLTGGHPEVSVIWTRDGVRLKARFDYLRVKTTVDAKTFACPEGREVIDAFAMAAHRYAYDMQAAHYGDARKAVPELWQAGHTYRGEGGEPTAEQLAFTAKVARYPEAAWIWLTIQTAGCPETDTLELPNHMVSASAQAMVAEAIRNFATYRDKFGEDALWVTDRGLIHMGDEVFSPSITSRGARRWEQAS